MRPSQGRHYRCNAYRRPAGIERVVEAKRLPARPCMRWPETRQTLSKGPCSPAPRSSRRLSGGWTGEWRGGYRDDHGSPAAERRTKDGRARRWQSSASHALGADEKAAARITYRLRDTSPTGRRANPSVLGAKIARQIDGNQTRLHGGPRAEKVLSKVSSHLRAITLGGGDFTETIASAPAARSASA